MPVETFDQNLQLALERLNNLWQRTDESLKQSRSWQVNTYQQRELVLESLIELATALEELQVAAEEMRQQNNSLAQIYQIIHRERWYHQNLFDYAPDCYLVTDTKGIILEANLKMAQLFQVECQHLANKPLAVFVDVEEQPNLFYRFNQIKKKQPVQDWLLVFKRQDGTRLQAACSVRCSLNEQGRVTTLIWRIQELETSLLSMNLNQPQHQLLTEILINQIEAAVYCVGKNARFLYVNDAACRLLEYSRAELLSMNLQDVDVDFPVDWSERWQLLKQERLLTYQSYYRTKTQKILPVKTTLNYVREQERELGCASTSLIQAPTTSLSELNPTIDGLQQEVSQLLQTGAELETRLSLLRGTFDSAAYGIIAVSFEGEVLNYNQKFLEIWQVPDSLILSKNSQECQNFFSSKLNNPEVFRRSVWEVSRESDAETYDILSLKDGRIFAQYSKPQRQGEEIIGRAWSILDITEFKPIVEEGLQLNRDETELQQAIEEAKHLGELRARFLSMLCHQFRSSLNIISFSNSLLKRYVSSRWTGEKKLPYLDNIQVAVEQISKLLDELVFLGKSEVGSVNFEPKPIDLEAFCRNLALQMQPMSDSHEQTINFTLQGDCREVRVDSSLLEPILINLLSNALKYSSDGSRIDFNLSCEEEKTIFQVKDTGIGITPVDQKRLFEPFYRGSNVDDIPGTGLGLAIAKNLVEIHNGQIEVESEVGVGTTFTVTLPASQ